MLRRCQRSHGEHSLCRIAFSTACSEHCSPRCEFRKHTADHRAPTSKIFRPALRGGVFFVWFRLLERRRGYRHGMSKHCKTQRVPQKRKTWRWQTCCANAKCGKLPPAAMIIAPWSVAILLPAAPVTFRPSILRAPVSRPPSSVVRPAPR